MQVDELRGSLWNAKLTFNVKMYNNAGSDTARWLLYVSELIAD